MPSLVQSVSVTGTASPLAVTLSATTAGNCLIVCAAGDGSVTNPVVTGITLGGAADNFAQVIAAGVAGTDNITASQWADPGCAGGQTALSIAFTSSGSASICVTVMEWSGLVTSSVADKAASQVSNTAGTSWSSTATGMTTQASEVAIGCAGAWNGTSTGTITGPGAPWTNLAQQASAGSPHVAILAGYQVLSSTGTPSYDGSFSVPDGYTALIATYKASGTSASAGLARATATALQPSVTRAGLGFPYKNLGVKVELLLNGTWTDVTAYTRLAAGISISPFGRANEASGMQAAQAALTFNNASGRFSPGNTSGAYYPYIQLNVQIRISVNDLSVNGTAYNGYRFWGEVGSWPAAWDESGRDSYVTVTAYGIWQRLSQAAKTLGSPYTRWQQQQGWTIAGYWPMEDGTSAPSFATLAPSTSANMTFVTGAPSLGACGNFRGSDALPALNQAELSGTITTAASPTAILFRFCLFPPTNGDGPAAGTVARLHLGGTLDHVDVNLSAGSSGPTTVKGYNASNTQLFSGSTSVRTWGQPLLVQVGLTVSGSTLTWSLNMVEQLGAGYYAAVTGSITGTLSDATSVIFNPGANFAGTAVGQAIVIYGNPALTDAISPLGGWQNEYAGARFLRICAEESVPAVLTGSSTSGTQMGPQPDDTLANVLQQVEDTDGGILTETRSQFGLGYRTLASMQNQAAAATVNYAAQQLSKPLQPVTDATLTRNDVTLTNYDGYAVRVYLASGARSIQAPPAGVGTGYAYTRSVSSQSHAQVQALAQQILDSGCVSDPRYPTVTVNLARVTTASLFSAVPSLSQGDYLALSNMPAYGGAASQKQLVWGWSEVIGDRTWAVTFNTVPEAPFEPSFSPGTTVTGQVPGAPVTIGQTGSVSGSQLAAWAVTSATIAASVSITSPTITGGTITGGTVIADGTSGELLVYSGNPVAGNLLVAVSGAAGSDPSGNAYSTGLTLTGQGSTPASISGSAILYGTSAGSLQAVDGLDGNTYQTQRLTKKLTSNFTTTTTTQQTLWSTPIGARDYRIYAWLLITANSAVSPAFNIAAPGSSGGQFSAVIARSATFYDLANFGVNSPVSLTAAGNMVSGNTYVVTIDGILSPSGAGSVSIQVACATTPNSLTVVTPSFMDLMPV